MFFEYDLPDDLIAQYPLAERDHARLLVIRTSTGAIEHHTVRDLPELLTPGDRLVFNETKVIPARLIGHRNRTGGQWECLAIRETTDGVWECLAKTRGYPANHETFTSDTGLTLELMGRTQDKHWLLQPSVDDSMDNLLLCFGHIPLPPYIRKGRDEAADQTRYQTVFAKTAGSVAAPTAGLHFTTELLKRLADRSIPQSKVTLHVGLGTFSSINTENPLEYKIHSEWCEVNDATVGQIQETKMNRGRVIAVGTTTTRTLETAADNGQLTPYRGETSIFIHPPYSFKVIDGLLTNFHLPRTTLLLLVQSLCGSDLLKRAYDIAIREKYRFFSYGDAMLILK
jgi:S-adenosylmethionine:tRNA ribosyltransferase-isomerase